MDNEFRADQTVSFLNKDGVTKSNRRATLYFDWIYSSIDKNISIEKNSDSVGSYNKRYHCAPIEAKNQ